MAEPLREAFSVSYPIRAAQHQEMEAYVDSLISASAAARSRLESFARRTGRRGDAPARAVRRLYYATIGYPPPRSTPGRITRTVEVGTDDLATTSRIWIEVGEGLHAYGLLLVPRGLAAPAPLVVAIHGGGGCPEAICDLDTRANYHAFGREAVRAGYVVWAPFILMTVSYGGDPERPKDRRYHDRRARMVGTSITAIEVHKIVESTRTLALHRPEVDLSRLGVTGLSYGGYFTLHAAAASPLFRAAACSGFFHDASDGRYLDADPVHGADMRFDGMLNTFDLTHTAALIHPRPLMIQHGRADEVVTVEGARRGVEELERITARRGSARWGSAGWLTFHEHGGGHEYDSAAVIDFFRRKL